MTSLNQDIREKLSRLNVFEKIIVAGAGNTHSKKIGHAFKQHLA